MLHNQNKTRNLWCFDFSEAFIRRKLVLSSSGWKQVPDTEFEPNELNLFVESKSILKAHVGW